MSENSLKKFRSHSSRDGQQSGCAPSEQWIEIIEPKSKVQMFANLITGECRWDEPKGRGVVISRATNPQLTQWWELYDNSSQRFYYYCAKDSKTVWKRPQNSDAIVVPLAKLQILKQNTSSATTPTQNSCKQSDDKQTQTEPQLCSRATQTELNSNYLLNSLRNPSLKHYLISEARLTHALRVGDNEDLNREFDYDSNDDDFDEVLDDSDLSCDADDEYDCDYSDVESSDDEEEQLDAGSGGGRYASDRRDDNYDTEDDIRRRRDARYDQIRDRTQINSLFAAQTSPTTAQPIGQSFVATKSHSLTQISSNNNRINQNIGSKRLTTTTTGQSSSATTSQTLGNTTRAEIQGNSRQLSCQTMIETKEELNSKMNFLSIESFAKENIERHRKRGIFLGKKVSLKSMLEWSKKSIKKPMISSITDQKLRNESKLMFKFVQKYMKDREVLSAGSVGHDRQHLTTIGDDNEIAFYLLTTATQQPILRDELLVQIARQCTSNPSPDSELRGLRLMCCCFWYFPSSHKLSPHLNAFLSSHSNVFARDVVKRKFEQQFRRSQQSHVVYVRKPFDLNEVSRVLRCVNNGFVGVFGECLSHAIIDHRLIPWPIVCLTEALLKCGANRDNNECSEREGVFRCVGDLDLISKLKIKIDTTIPTHDQIEDDIDDRHDIHVIASTLKLYFRELKEPLIPFEFYLEAIESAHDFKRAQNLVERLPKTNRYSLCYLIRFLQVFSAPEHVIYTKMDDANLSMVWAPNVLRNYDNSVNPSTTGDQSLSNIFERTRSEMSFVRTLIQNLDTSFMSGIQ